MVVFDSAKSPLRLASSLPKFSNKYLEVIQFVYDKLLDMKGNIEGVPVVLVGNKSDLSIEREVPVESGKRIAEKWKVPFVEASAKENQSVSKVFEQIVSSIERAGGNVPEKSGCSVS